MTGNPTDACSDSTSANNKANGTAPTVPLPSNGELTLVQKFSEHSAANLKLEKNKMFLKHSVSMKHEVDLLCNHKCAELELKQRERYIVEHAEEGSDECNHHTEELEKAREQVDDLFLVGAGFKYDLGQMFPGGCQGKSGQKSEAELKFESEPFSFRSAFYRRELSDDEWKQLMPSNSRECEKAHKKEMEHEVAFKQGKKDSALGIPHKKSKHNK